MARRQKKKQPATTAPLSVSDRIQRQLAASAVQKTRQGERPTMRETAALKALEVEREEQQRWLYYHTVPKRHYVQLSGRSHGVLNKQADRHGIPLRGRTIDLQAVLGWLHDFLAKYAYRLKALDDADPLLQGASTPALEQYRQAKVDLVRLEVERQRGNLLPKDKVAQALSGLNSILREAGETLQRQYGDDAAAVLTEAVEDWARGWRETLDDDDS
ncbi:unnamed protein product [marine sediment metagenome]|uniref:Uncharacterized protein n=1 Tax=marine sediment metagenome TaxID=412755 RepID=X1IZJ7_9ZZZZ